MTGTNTPTRSVGNEERTIMAANDSYSLVLVEPTADNADLYSITPPVYTQSIADGESIVDAEAIQEEKPEVFDRTLERLTPPLQLPRQRVHTSESPVAAQLPTRLVEETREIDHDSSVQRDLSPTHLETAVMLDNYLTEPVTTANLVSVRPCSILPDRLAIWLVRRRTMALSSLAAAVLTQEGLIRFKDLELISQISGTRRDPTDPISGMLLGAYDSVGEIMLGVVAGPVEFGRQASPMLSRYESRQRETRDGIVRPFTAHDIKAAPPAAAQVTIEAGKGLGRVVTASVKTPMLIMHGITRGFHNLPKTYGEEVRQFQNVTGLKSGLAVSGKSFVCGLGDGLTDLVTKPIIGAEQNGFVGFTTGIAKGFGNALFKPTAGACGLLGYTSLGIYKSIRKIGRSKKDDPAKLVHELGVAEYQQASDADKLHVVRVWCHIQMHVRLA